MEGILPESGSGLGLGFRLGLEGGGKFRDPTFSTTRSYFLHTVSSHQTLDKYHSLFQKIELIKNIFLL